MSFGRNLKRERELRGITLDEIAQHTRIGTRMLEAIESGRMELLPGGVFNRSFVQHYARYVGLDEDKVVAEFDLAFGTPRDVDVRKVAAQRDRRAAEGTEAPPGKRRRVALAAAIVLVVAAAAVTAWQWPALVPWSDARASAGSAAMPARPSPPPPRVPAPAGAQVRLRLQIDAVFDSSWAAVWTDDKKAWEAELRPGDVRIVEAGFRIRLRVGNAGAVVLTLNGETQPPLGRKGETRTIIFTAEDLKKSDANNGQASRGPGPG